MYEAREEPCDHVLAKHDELAADPAYASQGAARDAYEARIAQCYIEFRRPEKALALSQGWHSQYDVLRVAARAHAQLGQKDECRAALAGLDGRHRFADPSFFYEVPEFRAVALEDWFLSYAMRAWQRSGGGMPLDTFADRLAHRANARMLPLTVASADPQRRTGEWAVWTGFVRSGRLDRETGQTILIAEGVDTRRQVTAIDRKAESIEFERTWGGTVATPKYDETRHYREVFEPNGRVFVVQYPAVDERLVTFKVIQVFGRYAGRSGEEAFPTVSALAVMDRKAREHRERGP